MTETKVTAQEVNFGDGWIPANETWTYSSVDDPTGIITVPSDATTKYSVGMRISFVNATNTIYGIITAVTSTTITFLHEINPADSEALYLMANSAITVPKYSTQKTPFGFPLETEKWRILATDATERTQATPTQNTWYNMGSFLISVPIGSWALGYECFFGMHDTNTSYIYSYIGFSTSSSSESDIEFRDASLIRTSTSDTDYIRVTCGKEKPVSVTSKTSYYLIATAKSAGMTEIGFYNNNSPARLYAVCNYL